VKDPLALIDGRRFAQAESALSGHVAKEFLPRLPELGCRPVTVHYDLQGGRNDGGKLALKLAVEGEFELTCQRCLDPVRWAFSTHAELQLAASLEEIEAADDDRDRVLASESMDVGSMIEDEIILGIPMAPRHEQCSVSGQPKDMARISPFSALEALKRGG
jgi:uncharacterized protein